MMGTRLKLRIRMLIMRQKLIKNLECVGVLGRIHLFTDCMVSQRFVMCAGVLGIFLFPAYLLKIDSVVYYIGCNII